MKLIDRIEDVVLDLVSYVLLVAMVLAVVLLLMGLGNVVVLLMGCVS